MIATFVTSPMFIAFLLASLLLAATPGPGVLYIVARTVGQGRSSGLASVGGIALGGISNAAAASVGVAALLSASDTAFTVVKLAGAAYFLWLGFKTLCVSPAVQVGASHSTAPKRVFCDGFLVALLNPKTTLFFAALLPQFMRPGISALGQSLFLSCIFTLVALCTDTIYVLTVAALSPAILQRSPLRQYGRNITATTLICLGIYSAIATPYHAK
ncbi:MAG: LysE family translocator [Steroidobacteraceae bacterium]